MRCGGARPTYIVVHLYYVLPLSGSLYAVYGVLTVCRNIGKHSAINLLGRCRLGPTDKVLTATDCRKLHCIGRAINIYLIEPLFPAPKFYSRSICQAFLHVLMSGDEPWRSKYRHLSSMSKLNRDEIVNSPSTFRLGTLYEPLPMQRLCKTER